MKTILAGLCLTFFALPITASATVFMYEFEPISKRYLDCLTEKALENDQNSAGDVDPMEVALEECKIIRRWMVVGAPLQGIQQNDGTWRYRLTKEEAYHQRRPYMVVSMRIERLAEMRLEYCRKTDWCPW